MDRSWNVFADNCGIFREGTTEDRARQVFNQLVGDQGEDSVYSKIELVHNEQTVCRQDY